MFRIIDLRWRKLKLLVNQTQEVKTTAFLCGCYKLKSREKVLVSLITN